LSATAITAAFKHLVALSKHEGAAASTPAVLTAMLRSGASCLVAAKMWVPALGKLLLLDSKAVVGLLKQLQGSGRQLHAIAAHLHSAGHAAAASGISAFRRRQEEWLFAVKHLLADAGLGDAFWMGNLKCKDMGGAALGSQLVADVQRSANSSGEVEDNDAQQGHAPSSGHASGGGD
jgi:hypothetical protein